MTNLSSIYTAQKVVTTSGTPVRIDSQPVPSGVGLLIKAKTSNTGEITIGNSSANALNSGNSCIRLSPGDFYSFQVENANALWIDATVSTEGVEICFEQSN